MTLIDALHKFITDSSQIKVGSNRTINSDYFGFGFDTPFIPSPQREWDGRIISDTSGVILVSKEVKERVENFLLNNINKDNYTDELTKQSKFNIANDKYDNVKNKFKNDKNINKTVALIAGESSKFKKK